MAEVKQCSIDGCHRTAKRRDGWCHTCYDRYLRTGDPTKGRKDATLMLVQAQMPGECGEIAAKLGVSHRTVSKWIRDMRNAEPKECHISKWRRPDGKGKNVATYALGSRKDAPPLKRRTKKAIYERFMAKAKQTGDIDTIRARQLARYYANRAKQRPDPLVAALFGMAA